MADKPSRALVIYGDGCASSVSPSHSNLHSFASLASCGFLSLRDETRNDRVISDLAQLLDAYDIYKSNNEKHGEADADVNQKELQLQNITERFMGLRAAIFTKCPNVRSFASKLGFTILELNELTKEDPDDATAAAKVLQLLGFSGGNVLEKCEFDLVFLHIINSAKPKDQKEKPVISRDVDWLNKLVGRIMQTAQLGSSIASRLHFSIVLSFLTVSEDLDRYSLNVNSSIEKNSDLYLLRPRQSYTMKGGKILNDIRHHHPMLIAQWQEGVTRKDLSKAFSFREFKEYGVNLAILADRFLHEVAFKLWKAPKYGA
ncbi:uncharacterized protein A4U43_C06F13430 [Asparagus officinalis]|uniref:Uncharacterized protein n=1 Tax=Asparagus officinalis TaxID=4686 RepID=A0A5P1ELN8_ASPOF|nr:uncharacterized protein LOC109845093 isoform X2 [Asparagus officinalis]ONK66915.1 uncharacterized protein A4U43_C06F13430 [Asparagus officinalis]